MQAPDLVSLSDVKSWILLQQPPTPSTTDDLLLNRLIASASAFIRRYTARDLTLKTYSETRSGNGQRWLVVKNTPLNCVLSLAVNGVSVPPVPLITVNGQVVPNPLGNGYLMDERGVCLNGGSFTGQPYTVWSSSGYVFPRGNLNIVINYQAGWAIDDIPPDLQQVAIELVGLWYKSRDRIGVTGKGFGPEHISYLTNVPMPAMTKLTLDHYKRVFNVY